jgi:TDG/mug DNA glycosylase family protein
MASSGPDGRLGWPAILRPGLAVVFVGFNPSPRSWASRHRYAHPSNRFWALLADAGLTPRRMRPEDDVRMPELGYGFTDVVGRPSAAADDLAPGELRAGAARVRAELAASRPRIAAYTGKGVYRAVSDRGPGTAVPYGLQTGSVVDEVLDFVLPCPSGRSGMPYAEKVAWYRALADLVGALTAPTTRFPPGRQSAPPR